MSKHSGGKVGKAGKTLQDPNSTKKEKSEAGKKLNEHKNEEHK